MERLYSTYQTAAQKVMHESKYIKHATGQQGKQIW